MTERKLQCELTQKRTDTAGQERYRSLAPMYIRGAGAVILGFDVTHRDTMDGCDRWVEELHKIGDPDCVVVAVGNKIDLYGQRDISTEEAREHFESMEPPVPYFETSAKTGEGVNELFDSVVRLVIERKAESMNNNNNNNENSDEDEDEKDDKCIIC